MMPRRSVESPRNSSASGHRIRHRPGIRISTIVAPLITAAVVAPVFATEVASPAIRAATGTTLVRVHDVGDGALETLRKLEASRRGIEIWSERVIDGKVDVRVPRASLPLLNAGGLQYEIVIDDIEVRRSALFAGTAGASFFDSYQTHAAHIEFLTNLADGHPNLATVLQLGTSVQGRPIVGIRITAGAGDKPTVLYHGAQHGNEVMSPAVLVYLAQQLLEEYGSDPTITDLVDRTEWLILPISNPDGYESGDRYNANGVDLNRDWTIPGVEVMFSQPETQAIRDLLAGVHDLRAHVDLHSAGRGILWPWGYQEPSTYDQRTFRALGDMLADQIAAYRGTPYNWRGQGYETAYPTYGVSMDYSYGMWGTWSFVFELNNSQYPPIEEIVPTCIEIGQALQALTHWVVDCDGDGRSNDDEIAGGFDTDCNGNATPDGCEFDTDGDGTIDGCDGDIDNDGTANEIDACLFRPLVGPAAPNGLPAYDTYPNDCAVDWIDFELIMSSGCWRWSGPSEPAGRFCEQLVDADGDSDADLNDFAAFQCAFDPTTGE